MGTLRVGLESEHPLDLHFERGDKIRYGLSTLAAETRILKKKPDPSACAVRISGAVSAT